MTVHESISETDQLSMTLFVFPSGSPPSAESLCNKHKRLSSDSRRSQNGFFRVRNCDFFAVYKLENVPLHQRRHDHVYKKRAKQRWKPNWKIQKLKLINFFFWNCYSATAGLAYVLQSFCLKNLIFLEVVPCVYWTLYKIQRERPNSKCGLTAGPQHYLFSHDTMFWCAGDVLFQSHITQNKLQTIQVLSLRGLRTTDFRFFFFFPAPRTEPWNSLQAISSIEVSRWS